MLFCFLSGHPGRSESYLDAIRKNIEWLKKHNKDGNKDGKYLLDFTASDNYLQHVIEFYGENTMVILFLYPLGFIYNMVQIWLD